MPAALSSRHKQACEGLPCADAAHLIAAVESQVTQRAPCWYALQNSQLVLLIPTAILHSVNFTIRGAIRELHGSLACDICILRLHGLRQHKLRAASATGSVAQCFQCSCLKVWHAGACGTACRSQYSSWQAPGTVQAVGGLLSALTQLAYNDGQLLVPIHHHYGGGGRAWLHPQAELVLHGFASCCNGCLCQGVGGCQLQTQACPHHRTPCGSCTGACICSTALVMPPSSSSECNSAHRVWQGLLWQLKTAGAYR